MRPRAAPRRRPPTGCATTRGSRRSPSCAARWVACRPRHGSRPPCDTPTASRSSPRSSAPHRRPGSFARGRRRTVRGRDAGPRLRRCGRHGALDPHRADPLRRQRRRSRRRGAGRSPCAAEGLHRRPVRTSGRRARSGRAPCSSSFVPSTTTTLRALLATAGEAGIDALVEVHDERELDRALAADATLIGVNARDLDTLSIDRERALALLASARGSGATLVAESGLETADHLAAAADAGAHAVLIGTALLSSGDPGERLAELVATASTRTPAERARAPDPDPGQDVRPPRRGRCSCGSTGRCGSRRVRRRRRLPPPHRRRGGGELAGGLGTVPPVLVHRAPAETRRGASSLGVQLAGFDGPPAWLAEGRERPPDGDRRHPCAGIGPAVPVRRRGLVRRRRHPRPARGRRRPPSGADTVRRRRSRSRRRLNRIVPAGVAGGLDPGERRRRRARARGPPGSMPPPGSSATVDRIRGRIGAFVRAARRDPTGADRVDAHGRFGAVRRSVRPGDARPAARGARRGVARRPRATARTSPRWRRLQRDFIGRPTPLFEVRQHGPRATRPRRTACGSS